MNWVKHPIYNLYVSDKGEVKNTKIRKPRLDRYGYLRINISNAGKHKTVLIHNLVAECFIGVKQIGYTVNHKNGVKTDNYASNLEYVTPAQNTRHAFESGLVGTCIPVEYDGIRYFSMNECFKKNGYHLRGKLNN